MRKILLIGLMVVIAASSCQKADVNGGSAHPSSHKYVDLGLPSGLKWATCNLGASAPEQHGDYYAWGETEPYYSSQSPLIWKSGKSGGYQFDSYRWSEVVNYYHIMTKYNTNDGKTVLDMSDDVAHVKLGGKWRIPTEKEWMEIINYCTWTWTNQNGLQGRLGTSKINGNTIFLPATGYRITTDLHDAGFSCDYWSSSLDTNDPRDAMFVSFNSSGYNRGGDWRFKGRTVRPVTE